MKRRIAPLFLILVLTGCGPKELQTNPTWNANQVAIRINELSKTIIELNKVGQISDKDTREFGQWAVVALKTLEQVPVGWQKAVQTGWNQAKVKLPQTNPSILTTIAIIDALMTLLNPPAPPGV